MKIVIAAIYRCHRLLYHPSQADYRDWAEKFTLRLCFNDSARVLRCEASQLLLAFAYISSRLATSLRDLSAIVRRGERRRKRFPLREAASAGHACVARSKPFKSFGNMLNGKCLLNVLKKICANRIEDTTEDSIDSRLTSSWGRCMVHRFLCCQRSSAGRAAHS